MLSLIRTAPLVISILFSTSASAIVSMDDIHLGSTQEGFASKANFAINGASGNTNQMRSELGTHVQWYQQGITTYLLFNYRYGESGGQSDTGKAFVHARHIRPHSPLWDWELFTQAEHDKFTRLSLRTLVGTGIRLNLVEQPTNTRAFLGMGGFYAEEILEAENTSEADIESQFVRGNIYAIIQYKINPQLSFMSTTYYQPNIENDSDYRLLEEATLRVKVANTINIKLSLEYSFDNLPPLGVEKRDMIYQSGFEYHF